jgi:hypothetical protein
MAIGEVDGSWADKVDYKLENKLYNIVTKSLKL